MSVSIGSVVEMLTARVVEVVGSEAFSFFCHLHCTVSDERFCMCVCLPCRPFPFPPRHLRTVVMRRGSRKMVFHERTPVLNCVETQMAKFAKDLSNALIDSATWIAVVTFASKSVALKTSKGKFYSLFVKRFLEKCSIEETDDPSNITLKL